MFGNSYGRGFGSVMSTGENLIAQGIAVGVCSLLALIGGIILYFTFLSKKNEGKFEGFLGWLYDFLTFKKLLAEALLKVVYIIAASFVTLYGVALLFVATDSFGSNFLIFLSMVVFGNVGVRLIYEFLLFIILICQNVSEINKKLSAKKENGSIISSDISQE